MTGDTTGRAWDGTPTDDPYLAYQGMEYRSYLRDQKTSNPTESENLMPTKIEPTPGTIVGDAGGTAIDMRDENTRKWMVANTAARALALEILTGMRVGGGSALATVKRLGFSGRTKRDALRWLTEHYAIDSATVTKALAKG